MGQSSIHLNGNLMCAVDLETTGLQVGIHDIWQICILPLNSTFEPLKGVTPFYFEMKPRRPENANPEAISRERLAKAINSGIDPDIAADMLVTWFKKLGLPEKKKICPLAANWPFDSALLKEWLTPLQFDEIFHPWYRDVIAAACYANDSADLNVEQIPYPKCNLKYLCSTLKVENQTPHDALSDCLATAECYRKMLKRLF